MDLYSKRFTALLLFIIILTDLTGCQSNSQTAIDTDNVGCTIISTQETPAAETGAVYIVNINTGKFHLPNCPSVKQMNENNRKKYAGDRDDLISYGYEPCKRCEP